MSRKEEKNRRLGVEACLRDIRDSADVIGQYVEGVTEAQFRADPMRQDAVIRRIEIIGEAADRIIKADAGHAESLPGVPLAAAKLMRNKVIHDYDGVDPGVVWDTAVNDIPDLSRKITDALATRQTVQPPPRAGSAPRR